MKIKLQQCDRMSHANVIISLKPLTAESDMADFITFLMNNFTVVGTDLKRQL